LPHAAALRDRENMSHDGHRSFVNRTNADGHGKKLLVVVGIDL